MDRPSGKGRRQVGAESPSSVGSGGGIPSQSLKMRFGKQLRGSEEKEQLRNKIIKGELEDHDDGKPTE